MWGIDPRGDVEWRWDGRATDETFRRGGVIGSEGDGALGAPRRAAARQPARCDEESPSRRSSALIWPACVHGVAASRICRLPAAVSGRRGRVGAPRSRERAPTNERQLVDLLIEHRSDVPLEFRERLGLKPGLVRRCVQGLGA